MKVTAAMRLIGDTVIWGSLYDNKLIIIKTAVILEIALQIGELA